MRTLHRFATAISLFGLAAIQSCTPSSHGEDVASAEVSVATDRDRNKDIWWHDAGDQDLVAVWLSPLLKGEVPGGFRFVNLFFHDPACARPFVLSGSVARLDRAEPVLLANGSVEFSVVPRNGKTWAGVVTREDLNVTLTRL